MAKLAIFTCILLFIFYIITHILDFYYTIWTSNLWLFLYSSCFIFLIITIINIIMYILFSFNINGIIYHPNYFNLACWFIGKGSDIFSLILSVIKIIKMLNGSNYDNFIKNCPFSLSTELKFFNQSFYEKRRCELYNINMNSRYKYQYICSYNASESFKNDKMKDGLDKIICISKEHNIDNNEIIAKFSEIYECNDKNYFNLFYCSRIDKPEKDKYIREEICNNEKKVPYFVDIFFSLLDIIQFILNKLLKRIKKESYHRALNMMRNLERQLNDLLDQVDKDTECDESNSNNVSFNEEEDENIIIENHIVYNVDFNIKDFIKNEEKQKLD